LRSDNAGTDWSAVRTGILDDVTRVRAIGADSFVFSGGCALRRSDDGGATIKRLPWTPADDSCSPTIRSFSFPSSSVGYLLLSSGDVYATADAGQSWSKKSGLPGTSASAGGGSAAAGDIWFTADGTGVSAAGGSIYRTTDGATSWALVSNVATADLREFAFSSASNGLVVGKGKQALTTTDGGATWTQVNIAVGAGGVDLGSADCFDALNCTTAAADGSALFRTGDGGGSWGSVAPISSGAFGVAYSSPTRLVAVGGTGTTVVSDDGGATWSGVGGGVGGRYFGINVVSASTAYAFGDGGVLARTTDGGLSWSAIGASTSSTILDAAFPVPVTGFVLDDAGKLLRTSNSGASWQFLDTGSSSKPEAMLATNDKTVILIGPKGVRRSADGGDNFSAASGKGLKKLRLDAFDRAGSVIFAYSGKNIVVSTDQGKSWKPVKRPSKARTIFLADFVSKKAGYVLDTSGELWVTATAGKKWKRIETTGATDFESMSFGDIKHGYLSDDTGRILYTADGGNTWSRQYPFFDENANSSLTIQAASGTTAFAIVEGTNRFFSTTTGGTIGKPSSLTIKASAKKVKKNGTIKVTGKLSPAQGGEKVTVFARTTGKSGARWTSKEATVSPTGTFTTVWRIKSPQIFVARWSGGSGTDGDGAKAITVKLKR
jgi:photosystem II stability/assembly factor-like uncharacterized protein